MPVTGDHQLVAHIRRLASDGGRLYVRIGAEDVRRLNLSHGQVVHLTLDRGVRVSGIVKTSGASPWLAPGPDGSNSAITADLRKAGFDHGDDVPATLRVRSVPEVTEVAPASAARDVGHPTTGACSQQPASSSPVCLDSASAITAVREYNAGRYRGQANVDIDRRAYDRFRNGLPDDESSLVEMIRFVGEDYGGAQRRFLPHGYREEASLIVANLLPVLGQWRAMVASARPLAEGVLDEAALTILFAPFTGTKRWPVWASKTLHFLRPDAFPILDSQAKKALGLATLGSSPGDYQRFCSAFHRMLVASRPALEAARRVDGGISPSDLKLLDKILFQIGGQK